MGRHGDLPDILRLLAVAPDISDRHGPRVGVIFIFDDERVQLPARHDLGTLFHAFTLVDARGWSLHDVSRRQ